MTLIRSFLLTAVLGATVLTEGCSTGALTFPKPGPLVGPAGKGSFRFGVSTSATQIEDSNTRTDWYVFTLPVEQGGLGRGTSVGDAALGYTLALPDVELLKALHVDSYRFSMEWARIEPYRDQVDEGAIAHYSALLDALLAAGIRPVVTIHHFSSPVWVDDPRDIDCSGGPSDENLCGLGHPQGGPLVIKEMEEHARLLAERFGDRVDEWATLNEPMAWVFAAYGLGDFSPGKQLLFTNFLGGLVPVLRDYLEAHARMYRAIKQADMVDADGDGVNAAVGLTMLNTHWEPARFHLPSSLAADVAARDRVDYAFNVLVAESLRQGTFDADFDGVPEEQHPSWAATLDWLGVHYYFRAGVTAAPALAPVLDATPCTGSVDFGACLLPKDRTHCVPTMGYEFSEHGLYESLKEIGARWSDLPLVVRESGLATEVGERHAEHIVRSLEQSARARRDGVDVRGYYHWTLYDNFEWALGFVPRFGLYRTDSTTYARTPTKGADVLSTIAASRTVTRKQRALYGGTGPMTPDPALPANAKLCNALLVSPTMPVASP